MLFNTLLQLPYSCCRCSVSGSGQPAVKRHNMVGLLKARKREVARAVLVRRSKQLKGNFEENDPQEMKKRRKARIMNGSAKEWKQLNQNNARHARIRAKAFQV